MGLALVLAGIPLNSGGSVPIVLIPVGFCNGGGAEASGEENRGLASKNSMMTSSPNVADPTRELVSVLIVEDHHDTLSVFRSLLESYGYCVVSATRASEALQAVDTECPVCALVDLGLPDMEGPELIRRLRARCGDGLVIVVVTACVDAKMVSMAERAGADFVLSKPLQVDKFAKILPRLVQ